MWSYYCVCLLMLITLLKRAHSSEEFTTTENNNIIVEDTTVTYFLLQDDQNLENGEKTINMTIKRTNILPSNCGMRFFNEPIRFRPFRVGKNDEPAEATAKILNGVPAQAGEYPWMVAIFGRNRKHLCGGSLISQEYVLTAAHCFTSPYAKKLSDVYLTIGDYNIKSVRDGPHEIRKIEKLVSHVGFNPKTFHNDIALIKLNKPVDFTTKIQPICVPSNNETSHVKKANDKVIVAGWGHTSRSFGRPSDILRKVEIPIWDYKRCESVFRIFAPGRLLPLRNICAGDNRRSKDACIGDSGGPLFTQNTDGKWTQIGIVSWGKGCGSFPGVYTRLDYFHSWILEKISTTS